MGNSPFPTLGNVLVISFSFIAVTFGWYLFLSHTYALTTPLSIFHTHSLLGSLSLFLSFASTLLVVVPQFFRYEHSLSRKRRFEGTPSLLSLQQCDQLLACTSQSQVWRKSACVLRFVAILCFLMRKRETSNQRNYYCIFKKSFHKCFWNY